MDRRTFLQHTALGGAAAALGLSSSTRLDASVRWPIGCFNRPWTTWSFDETLEQIKAAGYQTTGLLTRTKDEPFIGADATPDYLAQAETTARRQRIESEHGRAAVAPQRAAGRVDQGSAAADRECRRPRPSLPRSPSAWTSRRSTSTTTRSWATPPRPRRSAASSWS